MKDMVTTALYENGDYWVSKAKRGYEVYKTGVTHSVRVAQINYGADNEKGFARAKQEADRRANLGAVIGPKGKTINPVIQAFCECEEKETIIGGGK